MNRESVDRGCERCILALVLAILAYGPLAIGAVQPFEFHVIQGLTLGVMLLWVARLWLNGRPQLFWPPICWAAAAFAVYAVARYLTSDIEYLARQEMIRVLVYAFIFFAILNNLHRQESTQIIGYTLIFLAMGIALYAVYQFVSGSDRVWHFLKPYPHRGSGTFISPNNLAGFLEMLAPLALAYTLTGRGKHVTKVFLGYASLAILAGIVVTVSRGGWLATAIALLLFFGVLILHRTYRLSSFVFLTLLVGVGLYWVPRNLIFAARTREVVTQQGVVNDDMRFALWKPALRLWQENFWWGVGPAHFNYRFRAYRPVAIQVRPERVHNDYLNTLTDWGLVGATLVTAAWVCLAVGVVKTWEFVRGAPGELGAKRSSNKFAFVLGASLGLTALLFHSVVDFNMHVPANAILAVSLMALLSGHLRFATERYWFRAGTGTKVLASAVVMAGGIYLGQQEWRGAAETAWLRRAAKAPRFSAAQIDCLKRAFAVEPQNDETAAAIGEAYRMESQEGDSNYEELAKQATEWFGRSIQLNRWNDSSHLRRGWCLDWLGKHDEAALDFERAAELDPNGYFTIANIGCHYMELEDYAAAKPCFERSLHLQWKDNLIAATYLQIANRRLLETATNNGPSVPLEPPAH
jgi:O-antigen ligase